MFRKNIPSLSMLEPCMEDLHATEMLGSGISFWTEIWQMQTKC